MIPLTQHSNPAEINSSSSFSTKYNITHLGIPDKDSLYYLLQIPLSSAYPYWHTHTCLKFYQLWNSFIWHEEHYAFLISLMDNILIL